MREASLDLVHAGVNLAGLNIPVGYAQVAGCSKGASGHQHDLELRGEDVQGLVIFDLVVVVVGVREKG